MLGEKLKNIREKLDLSQTDLSRITKFSQSSISNFEKQDNPDLLYVRRLCDYAKIPVWQLFIEENTDTSAMRPPYITEDDDQILKVLNTQIGEEDRIVVKRICVDALKLAMRAAGYNLEQA